MLLSKAYQIDFKIQIKLPMATQRVEIEFCLNKR